MDAIFTWKRLTSYDELESTFFWHYAKISTQTAGKFHNTILYTDEEGKKDFEKFGIGFNKVIVLPELESFKGSIFSIPKIYAMIQRKDPYVHLDFDVFTNIAHTTNEPIAFGYPEVDSKNFLSLLLSISTLSVISFLVIGALCIIIFLFKCWLARDRT